MKARPIEPYLAVLVRTDPQPLLVQANQSESSCLEPNGSLGMCPMRQTPAESSRFEATSLNSAESGRIFPQTCSIQPQEHPTTNMFHSFESNHLQQNRNQSESSRIAFNRAELEPTRFKMSRSRTVYMSQSGRTALHWTGLEPNQAEAGCTGRTVAS